MTTDTRPIFDVNVQINLCIPVHADNADQAIEIALGAPLEAHLADGNFIADAVNVEEVVQ